MSLGLDDLKKRKTTKRTEKKVAAKSDAIDGLRSNLAIKPWSNRGLAKAGVSRKQVVGIDFHVNEDWIEIQTQSFFWLNLNFEFEHLHEETDLRLQRKLSAFQKQILSSVDKVKSIVRFFGFSAKPTF